MKLSSQLLYALAGIGGTLLHASDKRVQPSSLLARGGAVPRLRALFYLSFMRR
jgi:hypothetical protein